MQGLNLFQIFTSRLNEMGIRYMITGAAAAMIYGEPRITHDLDLVIELKEEDIDQLKKLFPPGDFYCPSEESIRIETRRPIRGHFNIIHLETGFKADCYLMGKDELHHWGMSKRKKIDFEGESIWLAPAEYVILRKLEYYREGKSDKHLMDIRNILSISSSLIDFIPLEENIVKYGLEKEWKEAKKMSP